MYCLKLFQLAISLSFSNFIWPQLFILFIVQTANSKYKSWCKLLMEVYQWTNIVIMVIQFPSVTLCFAWKLFQLAISLSFSNFIWPQLFILFIVQTANSKNESWCKLLMEVYQWIKMVIMVIRFPRVTLCIAWSYFNLLFHSHFQISYDLSFSSYLWYKLQIQSTRVEKAINGSLSIDLT